MGDTETVPDDAMRMPVLLTFLLVAVALDGLTAEHARTSFRAMGTRITVTAYGDDGDALGSGIQRARSAIERRHRDWYPWRPDSELARINRQLAAGRPAQADTELRALLRRARTLERRSGGRFNPTIGELVQLWGFDQPPPYESPPPTRREIRAWKARRPSLTDLDLQGQRIRSTNRALQLDLGGIAKGAAVAAGLEALRDVGAGAALINAGGDVAGYGTKAGERWRIGIRDPRNGVLAALELDGDEAVFSSGDYERYRESEDGDRRGHVLNPHTGYPAEGAIHATVLTTDAELADAAATALLVAGRDHWIATARRMGVTYALIVDRSGSVRVSERLAERAGLEAHTDRNVVVRRLRPSAD
jgi:thiamine biosynthesis lipoprotein